MISVQRDGITRGSKLLCGNSHVYPQKAVGKISCRLTVLCVYTIEQFTKKRVLLKRCRLAARTHNSPRFNRGYCNPLAGNGQADGLYHVTVGCGGSSGIVAAATVAAAVVAVVVVSNTAGGMVDRQGSRGEVYPSSKHLAIKLTLLCPAKRGKNYNRFWGPRRGFTISSRLNPNPCTYTRVDHPIHNACIMPYAAASAIKIRSERASCRARERAKRPYKETEREREKKERERVTKFTVASVNNLKRN